MSQMNAAPLFPASVVFPDVDAVTLAREEAQAKLSRAVFAGGAWHTYLRKTLPPLGQQVGGTLGADPLPHWSDAS